MAGKFGILSGESLVSSLHVEQSDQEQSETKSHFSLSGTLVGLYCNMSSGAKHWTQLYNVGVFFCGIVNDKTVYIHVTIMHIKIK